MQNRMGLVALLVVILAINWLASVWHTRIDLTEEKRYTLSNSTKNLLRNIKEPLTIEVFLQGELPSGFKKLSGSTNDILREFKEVGGAKINYKFIMPEDNFPGTNVTYGDTLSSLGLIPINLTSQVKSGQQQQYVYPFAMVSTEKKTVPVTLYQGKTPLINFQELSSAEAMLEYNIAEGIAKATTEKKPTIGYTIGNGEPTGINTYDLVENVLKPNYHLFTFNPNTQPFVPTDFDVLMIVKPTQPFTDEAKLKLDQFVMNGGKLIMFIDRLNAELDSMQLKPDGNLIAYDRNLNIYDLLFKYGVRINPDLVMDLQCDFLPFDVNGNSQFDFLPWNYFPVFEPNGNNPIVKNIGFVSGRFVNSLDTIEAEGIKKTILLSSSANSRTIGTPAIISGRENSVEPEDARFRKAKIPTVVLLEGKFSSLYANRATQAQRDSLAAHGKSFISQSEKETKILVAGDGDMVLNSVTQNQPLPMGMNPYTYGSQRAFPFANKAFLENCLSYLINTGNLIDARNKDFTARLLDNKKTEDQRTFWQIINIVLPLVIVALFVFIFQWIRRRKYTTNQHG